MTPDLVRRISAAGAASCMIDTRHVLCRVLGDRKMVVEGREQDIAPHLILDGCWEPWITAAIATHLERRQGALCADVGAHYGYYSIVMMRAGAAHVTAFEPHPGIHRLLRRNMSLNGLNVECLELGAWSEECEQWLTGSHAQSGGSAMGDQRPAQFDYNLRARCVPLDWLKRRFDFIKIDAEGSEREIWAGMREHWQQSPGLEVCLEALGSVEAQLALYDTLAADAAVSLVHYDGIVRSLSRDQLANGGLSSCLMFWVRHT